MPFLVLIWSFHVHLGFGILAKTDKLDTKVLATFAAERKLEPQQLQDETQRKLKELIGWRR